MTDFYNMGFYRLFVKKFLFVLLISAFLCSCSEERANEKTSSKESVSAKKFKSGYRYLQALTGSDELGNVKKRWDSVYSKPGYVFGTEPAEFLENNVDMFPKGRALALAMGEGRNAVYLARKGFKVDGVDISEVAIKKARRLARKNGVQIQPILADLNDYEIAEESYELIVCFHFLLRDFIPEMIRGLKPGGYIIFENYTLEQLELKPNSVIPKEWLLEKGESKELFSSLKIVKFESVNDGVSAVERLIARKPLQEDR
jgi:2-polyprenyl-3-methyl-5-hydroxy-6-metoxy-1,4-benzoquinol methylase